jgi:phosphoribosyl 1,2-cyclic phosphate phosphodiesterase|tara:strand:- start:1116 stop:1880 length:765 start_codon:yes stop_codon:yes gene_type:complete
MSIKFIILGCGSSMGVPRIDGFFGNCDPNNKKNFRTRCSALINFNNYNILIDTSPDLRSQLLNNNIKSIDNVLYTHLHADQTHGINDLRPFYLLNKSKIQVYADSFTSKYLKKNFSYCFSKKSEYPPILKLNKIKKKMIFKKKIKIKAIPVQHGFIDCMSFIINNKLAYLSDVNNIYDKDIGKFKKLEYLVVDCLRFRKHPSHFNLEDIINLTNLIKPKKTILTNLHSDLDYKHLLKILPKHIKPGYDGLTLKI